MFRASLAGAPLSNQQSQSRSFINFRSFVSEACPRKFTDGEAAATLARALPMQMK